MALGLTKSDFEDNALSDLGRTVTRTPRTKTISNVTGAPTYSNSSTEDITGIFTKRAISYSFSKEGLVEKGDAFLQIKEDQSMEKEDLITVDSEVFRVDEVLPRVPSGTRMFKSCVLFKVN